ncbi:DUF4173 domain-containing protein [Clostridium aestuarii]|uniref:DUF4173 domain-containing protein n=1 Tax=Clostridium aestuarii TaxID=338193 RepID=A0ABT4D0E9_9CLOT|nr:DUF4153 domain-containing protein [Clostridium aestuarii]MCY6484711.1 DUF4173 domain-containing protein [Clostridium aestuarii]
MENKKVQAIIIKDRSILIGEAASEFSVKRKVFIRGIVKENETEENAIKRELKEQLNLECKITFKFSRELNCEMATFLVDLSDKNVNIDYDINNIKCFNKEFSIVDLNWIQLSDTGYLWDFEASYMRLLVEECIENQYKASWIDIIENVWFKSSVSRKYLQNKYLKKERKIVDSKEDKSEKLKAVFCALMIGILFNYFFIWDCIGISAIIFNAVVIGAVVWLIYPKVNLNKRLSFIFLIPIILLSITYCIYNNEALRTINGILTPLLIAGYIMIIRYENIKDIRIGFIKGIFDRIFPKSFSAIPKFLEFTKEALKSTNNVKEKNAVKRNVFKGLMISIPLLIIVIPLLTSADMMFKYYLQNIETIFENVNVWNFIGHGIVILAVTLYMFGFIWSFKYNEKEQKGKDTIKISAVWEPVTIMTIIFVICIVYLIFSVIQFSYLYGEGTNTLPLGVSHSEYARTGFFELISVTLINFAILIFSIKLCKNSISKIDRIANISYSLLIVFTFNMLFSANYKMNLYEKAFGYTRLRIFVQVFMILVGILLIIVLLGIWNRKVPVLKLAVISGIIVYIGLNFMNVDRVIAKANIERYMETKKIDMRYLETLSYDAAPEMAKLLDKGDIKLKKRINKYIEEEQEKLKDSYNHWYEFNYYKNKFLN